MWNLTANSPFSQLRNLQKEINDLFGGFSHEGYSFPRVNVQYNGNEIRFLTEAPGLIKDDISINVIGNQLSIEVEKKEPEYQDEVKLHRREINYGKFIRSFDLPYEVNPDKVKAKLKNGILEIELPRAEQSKPKKISILAE
jgi:HSP20 family protein